MPKADPIIEELHATRAALAQASNHDLAQIAAAARSRQRQAGRESVRLPPKRTQPAKQAS